MCANALGITDLGHGGKIAVGFIAVISGYAASYFTALCAAPKKSYSIIKSTVIFIFVFRLFLYFPCRNKVAVEFILENLLCCF